MKMIAGLLVIALSSVSFAQSNVSKAKMGSGNANPLKGLTVGLDYMNLTDVKTNFRAHMNGMSSEEQNSHGGTSLGTVGVRVGYTQKADRGFGWQAGARYLETMNTSETNGDKYQILIPEVNGSYALDRLFAPYVGLNYSKFIAPSSLSNDYTGDFGMQFGFSSNFTKNISAGAGYTMLNQNYSSTQDNYRVSGDVRLSGFNANVNYIF